jgi:hypothetical protein
MISYVAAATGATAPVSTVAMRVERMMAVMLDCLKLVIVRERWVRRDGCYEVGGVQMSVVGAEIRSPVWPRV